MADADEDYRPPEEDTAAAAVEDPSPHTRTRAQRVARANSSGDITINVPKKRARIPDDLQQISQMQRHVKKRLKGQDVGVDASLRVTHGALKMQRAHLEDVRKLPVERRASVEKPKIRERICAFYGISTHTCGSITSHYFNNRKFYSTTMESAGRGNRTAKDSQFPRTKQTQIMVREFVRQQRKQRARVTGKQILDFLLQKKVLHVPVDNSNIPKKKECETAHRAVRRFLQFHGYHCGKRKGNVGMTEAVKIKRAQYLHFFFANRALPPEQRLREVMMDESYIHEHYHRNDDSCWDPSDEQDIQIGKAPAKGRRYCFAAAIQGHDPRFAEPSTPQQLAGLVPNSVWAFCPQKKEDHKGDYHKVFNGDNFAQWWRDQLLPNLKQPSVVCPDNAKYHLVYPPHVPKVSKMKKAELMDYLRGKLPNEINGLTVPELKAKARKWIEDNEKIAITALAEAQGHKVVFTPPYHSDLQPIELVWALVKGAVGRQYSIHSSLQLVFDRLLQEFANLDTPQGRESIRKMIEKCAAKAKEFYDDMQTEEDDIVDDNDDSNSSGEEKEGDSSDSSSIEE